MKKLLLLPGGLVVLAALAFVLMPRASNTGAAGIEALAAQQAAAPKVQSVHDQLIAETDLPPEGSRSLFDHLVRDNGSLPFPFDRVIDWVASYDANQQPPRTLLIPDGRSLLKGFAHFSGPRIVLAANAQPPAGAMLTPRLRGRLFLGFVEDANEIEVISYNEVAGRFEFQLVQDYCAGCVPRIVYAQRAICTTCHSGRAPIFPVRPWEETSVNPQISAELKKHLQDDRYYSVPVQQVLDDGQRFDNLTDTANTIITTQKIWLDGCGQDGNSCRREMLRLALRYAVNPSALDDAGQTTQVLLDLQARHWPNKGIALANGDLKNRNPLGETLYQDNWWQQLRSLFGAEESTVRSGDKLGDFDQLPALPPEFDPLTPRPPKRWIQAHDLDGVYGVAQMFSAHDIAWLERLSGNDPQVLDGAVSQLSELHFEAAPFQRISMMNALTAALGQTPREYCCEDTSEMSDPIVQGEPPLQLAADSVLLPFEKYCFACHRGNPAARLNFMSGADEASVLAAIKDTSEIRDVLDYERYLGTRKQGSLMPPADSWQRQALLQARESGEQPLKAMREQVPALFEF